MCTVWISWFCGCEFRYLAGPLCVRVVHGLGWSAGWVWLGWAGSMKKESRDNSVVCSRGQAIAVSLRFWLSHCSVPAGEAFDRGRSQCINADDNHFFDDRFHNRSKLLQRRRRIHPSISPCRSFAALFCLQLFRPYLSWDPLFSANQAI